MSAFGGAVVRTRSIPWVKRVMLLFFRRFGDKTLGPEKVPVAHRCTCYSPTCVCVCTSGLFKATSPPVALALTMPACFSALLFSARTLQIRWNTKVENRTVGRFCKAHRATLFSEIRQQVVGHFFIHCADQRELRTESKEMQYCVV